jgi:hypothetical protein
MTFKAAAFENCRNVAQVQYSIGKLIVSHGAFRIKCLFDSCQGAKSRVISKYCPLVHLNLLNTEIQSRTRLGCLSVGELHVS